MPGSLNDITREAVLAAIAEYDRLGQEEFLSLHGFDRARQYVLVHDGKRYDSKAIVGVAHGFLPGKAALAAGEFSGGKATAGQLLARLGFHVEERGERPVDTLGLSLNEPAETSPAIASFAEPAASRPRALRPGDWTEAENRAIVDDYLVMLALESVGKPYSKTEHRNALIEAIGGTRSPGVGREEAPEHQRRHAPARPAVHQGLQAAA
jgi:hypothetical protein